MFYEFSQNNSGGSFDVDDKICHRLIIEANSAKEANFIAEKLGCYWDGCEKGFDCSCCGDRWDSKWRDDDFVDLKKYSKDGWEVSVYEHYQNPEKLWYEKYGEYQILEEPKWESAYGFKKFIGKIIFKNIEQYAQFMSNEYGWTNPDIRIYYKDGIVKEIYSKK